MTTLPEPVPVKPPATRSDAHRMGELFRRVCYPLFLPAIVLAVWAQAWAAKVDAVRPLAPVDPDSAAAADAPVSHCPAPYGFSADDAFAAADADRE